MNETTSFRDAESISAYLDDQLSQAEKARLETRIKTDPQLRKLFDELSESRSLLRKLPARRAPRNFTLTPKMAGVRPPMPRIFPVFRFASALAAILFFFSFTANLSVPTWAALRASAPAPIYGRGGGGGGGDGSADPSAMAAPQAENSLIPGTATPEYSFLQEAPTQAAEMPAATEMAAEPEAQAKIAPPAEAQPAPVQEVAPIQLPVPAALQFVLLGLAVVSGVAAYFVRSRAENAWFKARSLKPTRPGLRQVMLILLVILLIAALTAAIYLVSTTTFYAPISSTDVLPMADKGPVTAQNAVTSGDKGGAPPVGDQGFTLTPGLGYIFSSGDSAEELTAADFPADVFATEMFIAYMPGLSGLPVNESMVIDRAFSLLAADMSVEPQKAYTISLDYSDRFASLVDENSLVLYWWSGDGWQDAAETCSPASVPDRQPDINRLGVAVCKMGTFILAAP